MFLSRSMDTLVTFVRYPKKTRTIDKILYNRLYSLEQLDQPSIRLIWNSTHAHITPS